MSSIILKRVPSGHKQRCLDIERVVHALEELPCEREWKVVVEPVRSKRSTDANEYYWGCVIEMISNVTGYEPEEVHEYLCGLRWGWKQKKVPKTPHNPGGIEDIPVRTTTTDAQGKRCVLTIMEFYEYVEFCRRFASIKLALNIPDPDKNWKELRARVAA